MGKLRKIGKKIGRGFKKVGKRLKSGLGKVAKAFGKLGPLGSIALSFILPGVGSWISSVAGQGGLIGNIATGLMEAGKFIKGGVQKVFNSVTGAIEHSMNAVSKVVPGGEGKFGTNFRNWVSETTGGFIEKSESGLELEQTKFDTKLDKAMERNITDKGFDGSSYKEVNGVFEFRDAEGKVIETIKSPEALKNEAITEVNKPSILEKGEYDSFKERTRGSREYAAYKKIQPITSIGTEIRADEEAEKFAAQQARQAQAKYYSDVAQQTLMKTPDPFTNYIDFNNPNPSDEDIYALNNAYGSILS